MKVVHPIKPSTVLVLILMPDQNLDPKADPRVPLGFLTATPLNSLAVNSFTWLVTFHPK